MQDIPHCSWPDAADYRYLEGASRSQFAWEWLQRDPDYRNLIPSTRRKTARSLTIIEPAPASCRERWGCLFIEDADERDPDIPMLWDPSLDASVLRVEARSAAAELPNVFDLDQCESKAALVQARDGDEHCLLYRGRNHIHLHVIDGTLLEGPVQLRFYIGWSGVFEPAISTLRRFLYLCRSGDILPDRPVSDRTRHRALSMLRVHDALTAGASIRDIGIMLFGLARIEAEWRDPGESLKSQCRRLIAAARTMAAGGYKELLRKL